MHPRAEHFWKLHLHIDLDKFTYEKRTVSNHKAILRARHLLWQHEFGAGSLCTKYSLTTGQTDPFEEAYSALHAWLGHLPWYASRVAARMEQPVDVQHMEGTAALREDDGVTSEKLAVREAELMCKDREILTNCYKLDKSDGSHIWDPFNYVSRPFDIDKYVMKATGMFTDSVNSRCVPQPHWNRVQQRSDWMQDDLIKCALLNHRGNGVDPVKWLNDDIRDRKHPGVFPGDTTGKPFPRHRIDHWIRTVWNNRMATG